MYIEIETLFHWSLMLILSSRSASTLSSEFLDSLPYPPVDQTLKNLEQTMTLSDDEDRMKGEETASIANS
jgi:hypothetical protein